MYKRQFILIVVPLLLIVLYSVTTGGNSLVNIQFTGENFKKIFEPVYMNGFIRSFKLGAITTIISLIIGYMPVSYTHLDVYKRQ